MEPSHTNITIPRPHFYCLLLTICSPVLITAYNDCLMKRDIKNTPYLQFSIQAGLTCWDYCNYLHNCTALSFQYDRSGRCSFYNVPEMDLKYQYDPRSGVIYSGSRRCQQVKDARGILENEAVKGGIFIHQEDTGVCLGVSSAKFDSGENELIWLQDCRDANLWIIKNLGETKKGDMVKVTDTTSKNCLSIIEVMIHYDRIFPPVAMKNCSNDRDEKQEFILAPSDYLISGRWKLVDQVSLQTVHLAELRTTAFDPQRTAQNRQLLTKFTLLKPHLPCERLTVEHGRLLLDPSQPLLVPGERIPVLCDPGYGVRTERGYTRYFVTVCSNDLVTPICVDLSLTDSDSKRGTIAVPSVVFFVVVVVVTAVVLCLSCVICYQRRRTQHLQSSILAKRETLSCQ